MNLEIEKSAVPGQTESVEDIERFLRSGQKWLRNEHREGLSGPEFCRQHSSFMDRVIQRLFKRAQTILQDWESTSGISLLAMGGYGRQELNPFSDIDLLVLHPSGKSNNLEGHLQAILHPLWDWGLTVGYTVQTPKESLRAAQKDLDLFFSFLDSRWIAGDKGTFLRFREEFGKAISGKETENNSRNLQEGGKPTHPPGGFGFRP